MPARKVLEPRDEFEAVHARRAQVHDHDAGRSSLRPPKNVFWIGVAHRPVSEVAQGDVGDLERRRIVIHHVVSEWAVPLAWLLYFDDEIT